MEARWARGLLHPFAAPASQGRACSTLAPSLQAAKAGDAEHLNRVLFVQCGFGCDQHGDRSLGSTKAAVRAVRDALSFNSIPGMVHAVPGGPNLFFF